jgi:flavodoxin I
MKALIAYDSKYGNTEKIATMIMDGMKEGGIEVSMKKGDQCTADDFKAADVWVFGSPVHVGGATGDAKKALKLALETGASGKKGTAFDTRFASAKGGKGAAEKMGEKMAEAGMKIVAEPQWFIVEKTKGPLAAGEEDRAKAMGKKIAEALKS